MVCEGVRGGRLVMVMVAGLVLISSGEGEHLAINWSDVGTTSPGPALTSHHPTLLPLTPCPCDLAPASCDLTCCCDEDCSKFEKESLRCGEGVSGGHQTDQVSHESCQYRGPYSPEWHRVLCVVTQSSPYLGLFYTHEPVITTFQRHLARVARPAHSYEDTSDHIPDSSFHQYYILGSVLETILPSNESEYRGVLLLPQQLLNGICVRTMLIYFLEEFSIKCPLALSPAVCETEPLLNPVTYLRNTDRLISDPYLEVPQVIANLTSLEIVNASVEYECLGDDTAAYIKLQPKYGSRRKQSVEFWSRREASTDGVCDGSNPPHYNSASLLCENVVLGVEYNFGWSGPSITKVQAKITIGNVPVSLEPSHDMDIKASLRGRPPIGPKMKVRKVNKFLAPSTITKLSLLQHFTVTFHHSGTPETTYEVNASRSDFEGNMTGDWDELTVEDAETRPGIFERSGNPGYQLGRPLLAGYAVYGTMPDGNNMPANNTTPSDNSTSSDNTTTPEELVYVAINTSTGLYIWQPDASGECKETSLEEVTFGVDKMSSCVYHWSHLNTCQQLRESVESVLSSVVQADVVAKMGWPNVTVGSDFLPLLFETGSDCESEGVSGGAVGDKARSSETESNETVDSGVVSSETEGSEAGESEADRSEAVCGRRDMCLVPDTLEYWVLYQDVGPAPTAHTSLQPVYQVVGALVRYHYRDVQLTPASSLGWISLTTSVTFSHIPTPSTLSRFWEKMEDRWCGGGTCWRELLHPWTHGEAGEEGPHSTGSTLPAHTTHLNHFTSLLANTLLLVALAVPVVIVAFSHR